MEDCVKVLKELLNEHIINDEEINSFMVDENTQVELEREIEAFVHYAWNMLYDILCRYVGKLNVEVLFHDVLWIVVGLFRPYFKKNEWIDYFAHEHQKQSEEIQYEVGLFISEDSVYYAFCVYLADFVNSFK